MKTLLLLLLALPAQAFDIEAERRTLSEFESELSRLESDGAMWRVETDSFIESLTAGGSAHSQRAKYDDLTWKAGEILKRATRMREKFSGLRRSFRARILASAVGNIKSQEFHNKTMGSAPIISSYETMGQRIMDTRGSIFTDTDRLKRVYIEADHAEKQRKQLTAAAIASLLAAAAGVLFYLKRKRRSRPV